MFLDLLHFGDGPQAINYFIFCFGAILGTIQAVAVRYTRRDLIWLDGTAGYWLGATLVGASFVWFFATDQEIFIPGLAGGELFTIFVAALIIAVPATRIVAFVLARIKAISISPTPRAKATEREEPLP